LQKDLTFINVYTFLHFYGGAMTTTILSSREFNQDTGKAKKAALQGPVFITDRGKASYVLLTVEEYRKMCGAQANIIDLLAMPDAAELEFQPPKLNFKAQVPDLS
jgi:PHD/YefM family antitoxin component YafN of YafNO toxin-antitoxin module